MEAFEKHIKAGLVYAFCFLNVIDLVQTLYFLKVDVEGNPFVVSYPNFWFVLKVLVAFGVPIGLYRFDLYLEEKESEGVFSLMKSFVRILGTSCLSVITKMVQDCMSIPSELSILGSLLQSK